ncbi:MAG: DUF397 domain-containing protein [Stackebrandtia sp.]
MINSADDRYGALAWRKSSRSNGNGGQCVEAAMAWRKTSRSNGNGASCVEAAACPHHVALRDSKLAHLADYPVLSMSSEDWRSLLKAVSNG